MMTQQKEKIGIMVMRLATEGILNKDNLRDIHLKSLILAREDIVSSRGDGRYEEEKGMIKDIRGLPNK